MLKQSCKRFKIVHSPKFEYDRVYTYLVESSDKSLIVIGTTSSLYKVAVISELWRNRWSCYLYQESTTSSSIDDLDDDVFAAMCIDYASDISIAENLVSYIADATTKQAKCGLWSGEIYYRQLDRLRPPFSMTFYAAKTRLHQIVWWRRFLATPVLPEPLQCSGDLTTRAKQWSITCSLGMPTALATLPWAMSHPEQPCTRISPSSVHRFWWVTMAGAGCLSFIRFLLS